MFVCVCVYACVRVRARSCIQALAARASEDLLEGDSAEEAAGCTSSNNTTLKSTNRPKYRDSKLTLLLKNSLEGNAILVMIAVREV
jgi:hypothetical protein